MRRSNIAMRNSATPLLTAAAAPSSTGIHDHDHRRHLPLAQQRRVLLVTLLMIFAISSVPTVSSKVYIAHMNDCPAAFYNGEIPGYPATAPASNSKLDCTSSAVRRYREYVRASHDQLLESLFPEGGYTKLYSYSVVLNGFAVDIPEDKAHVLISHPGVTQLESNLRVKTRTTYTPEYLGLPSGAWAENGGVSNAGENIVLGIVDTGINPTHPSFANDDRSKPYGPLESFSGSCEVAPEFPAGSCNYKLIGARHFSAALEAEVSFNETQDFASPLDGEGHGTHTAATAGGNSGVPVVVDGLYFGQASGIAPRARIAVYKALYRNFGGTTADVVAAIDQGVADGVDILSLSLGPGAPPDDNPVYFNALEVGLLGAVRANIFVTQAAGNDGPFVESALSFSPWIVSVAASYTDRNYTNTLTLGNGITVTGDGLAAGTPGEDFHTIVLASEVNVTSNPNVTVSACQSSEYYDRKLVQGNLLVCVYGIEYFFGIYTTSAAVQTAKNLTAAGVIFVVDAEFLDFQYETTILGHDHVPAIRLTSSKAVKEFFKYYNASTKTAEGDHCNNVTFGAKGKLNGGSQAFFTGRPPVVAEFSSRGPVFDNTTYIPSDVLKPNVMAPGVAIWAAWSPIGLVAPDFLGENFAIISGTSMATPHVAGIAALVKEKNPTYSPAAIHSALAGTAYSYDKSGAPLPSVDLTPNYTYYLAPATPFDLGSGQVDPQAALDPGLVFEAGIDDYRKFLCLTPTANSSQVLNATGAGCPKGLSGHQSDLNAPYIAVGVLAGPRVVPRTVTSVSKEEEFFTVELQSPPNVTSTVAPTSFTIAPGHSQSLSVCLTPQVTTNVSTFGHINFRGNCGHFISIPIAVAELQFDDVF